MALVCALVVGYIINTLTIHHWAVLILGVVNTITVTKILKDLDEIEAITTEMSYEEM